MSGGCWICNPMCGRCQPAPMKSGKCPACGETTIFERRRIIAGERLLCKKCGHDMSELVVPRPVRCNYSGKVCAYPCGKSSSPKHEHGDLPCERNTPLSPEMVRAYPFFGLRELGKGASSTHTEVVN